MFLPLILENSIGQIINYFNDTTAAYSPLSAFIKQPDIKYCNLEEQNESLKSTLLLGVLKFNNANV